MKSVQGDIIKCLVLVDPQSKTKKILIFTMIEKDKNYQMFELEKLEPKNFFYICSKNSNSVIKIVADYISVEQLIN